MYYLLSIIAGIMISIIVTFNGQLSDYYGIYFATAWIHFIGLIFITILVIVKKKTILHKKNIPFHYYLGGVVGLMTVVISNFCFGKISVSAILALGLLGQSITSLFFDQFGFFNMPKRLFYRNKLIGILIVIIGIVVMISAYEISAALPIVLSLLTGFAVVLSRTMNAGLSEKTSVLNSTFYNYITGFILSVILFALIGNTQILSSFTISPNVLIYIGGIIGIAIIIILNATVAKISSFYMTLLLFSGQIFSALLIDLLLSKTFSTPNFLGGIFVVLGLSVNVWIDKKRVDKDKKFEPIKDTVSD